MPRSSKPSFQLWMLPAVHNVRQRLPGDVRNRIAQLIEQLQVTPRPANSITLTLSDSVPEQVRTEWEVRRIRIDDWRIIYAVNETWREIGVLTIRQRPPYDYSDLVQLLAEL